MVGEGGIRFLIAVGKTRILENPYIYIKSCISSISLLPTICSKETQFFLWTVVTHVYK